LEFSWVKTIVSLGVILLIIYFGIHFLLKLSRSVLEDAVTKDLSARDSEISEILSKENEPPSTTFEETPPSLFNAESSPSIEVSTKIQTSPLATSTLPKKSSATFKVIVGSFVDKKNAVAMVDNLKKKGIDAFVLESSRNNKPLFRVQSGAFANKPSAVSHKRSLEKKGIDCYVLER
jgi:cell division septation protein DedD